MNDSITPNTQQTTSLTVADLWEKSLLRITDECKADTEVLFCNGSVIGTLGNFSASTGKAKSRKTFNVTALTAAALKNGEVLAYIGEMPEDKRGVLYIDTEQSPYHCQRVIWRILRLAGLPVDSHPDNFKFASLRPYSPEQRLAMIDHAIATTPGIGLVVIDGIRDLMYDINNATEATNVITRLMAWTDRYQIHIHTVLHQNKADDNVRGHIGTELNNKAETVLQIAKNTEDNAVSEVTAPLIRSIDMEPVAFTVNDEGLPEQKFGHEFGKKAVKRGFSYTELTEEQHRAALEATFANGPIKKYRNLIPALMENYAATVGFKRCYSIITELKKFLSYKRMIVKDDRLKAYVYNPEARY